MRMTANTTAILAILAIWGISVASLTAQEVVGGQWRKSFRVDATVTFNYDSGGDVAYIEDLDGDGWPEILVGEVSSGMESVMAFSGRTGSFLWLRPAPAGSMDGGFGSRITVSIDLLHSSAPSIIASGVFADSNTQGQVLVGDTRDLGRPWLVVYDPGNPPGIGVPPWTSFGLGYHSEGVVGLPDMDGDWYEDLLVGAPGASQVPNERSHGAVFAFTLSPGTPLLWRLDGAEEFGNFGSTLAVIGDLTGDGRPEVAIGETGSDVGALVGGAIHILDPYNQVMVASFYGPQDFLYYGTLLEPLGDVNGDGVPDLLTGSPGPYAPFPAGYVRALSGADGSELWTVVGMNDGEWFGNLADTSHDVDGDGIQDVVVTAAMPVSGPPAAPARVDVLSGATGELLWSLSAANDATSIGPVAAWAELRGGISPRVVLDRYNSSMNPDNWTEELTFDPFLWASRRTLRASAGGQVKYALDFPDTAAGQSYQLLASRTGRGPTTLRGLEVPLTRDALFRRSLQGPLPWTNGSAGLLDAFGDAVASFTPPPGALSSWVDTTLWTAAVSYGPGGPALSSVAVPLHVLP